MNQDIFSDLHQNSLTLPVQEYDVVTALRRQRGLSRTDLAKQLTFSRARMTGIVTSLINANIIEETIDAESTGGRRAKILNFRRDFGYVIGIDLGATSVDIVIADFRGEIMLRQAEPLDVRDGPDLILSHITTIASAMLDRLALSPEKVLCIGIGVPGPVDFAEGVLVMPPIMPGWERYPIRETLHQTFFNATVIVDNDVNMMAMGALRQGAGCGVSNFIYVKVGTGIGAGIVIDSKLYRGNSGCAGDIGHIQAKRNSIVCHCGNVGCLEALASGSAIARQANKIASSNPNSLLAQMLQSGIRELNALHVGEAARAGDTSAIQLIQNSGLLIGEVLASVVNFFNPHLILIGGGVSKIGNQFLPTIRHSILSRSLPLATQDLRIDYSKLGDDAGVIGAVALALDYVFIAKT